MKPILSNPQHGWCTFYLQNDTQTFTITPSYLTDVMFDTLYAIQSYLTSGISVVKYDCEEHGEVIFIIDQMTCYVISAENNITSINRTKTQEFNITGIIACKNLLKCFETDINKWIGFAIFADTKEEYKNEFQQKAKEYEKLKTNIINILTERGQL